MSGFQLNAKVAKRVDLDIIPISLLKPVLNRNYFKLIDLLKRNTYLANQISFFYYQQLVGNASLLNNNKESANVRVPWDSMYQDMTGKVLILSPYDQYQLYMWVTVNNTQNMATQSNFQFLLFSLGNYMTQLNTAQRTLNQKLNAQYYFPLGVNVKNNNQMKKFLANWVNIPTSPPSNQPTPTPPSPPTVPSAPTILSILGVNTAILVYYNAPSNDGGSTIIYYEYSTNNGSTWTSSGTISSPITISGLTNGISYPVVIRAVNSIGEGASSNTFSGTPNATQMITSFTTTGSTTWTSPAYTTSIEYLIVGGGGGGGGAYDTGSSGGGGAGLVLTGTVSVTPNFTYNIYVGSGGAGGTADRTVPIETNGGNGENSFFNAIIATGGSGGFRSRYQVGGGGVGGTIADAGLLLGGGGGNGGGSAGTINSAGGGGGNGSPGGTSVDNNPGVGGSGIISTITGSSVTYGAGGIGGRDNQNANGVNGTANTGNGGGGAGSVSSDNSTGGNGGSGIVILKYFQ
jgi:hypothetical protein